MKNGSEKTGDERPAKNLGVDARIAAKFCNEFMMTVNRGAMRQGEFIIVFGNDGYKQDPRVKHEMVLTWIRLESIGLWNPTIGSDGSGYSWALVYWLDDPSVPAQYRVADETKGERALTDAQEELASRVNEIVWAAWKDAGDRVGRLAKLMKEDTETNVIEDVFVE